MNALPQFTSWISISLLLLLVVVLTLGVIQYFRLRSDAGKEVRSLVAIGWIAVALSFVGYFKAMSDAFTTIQVAGDISPSLIAGAIAEAPKYPVAGFTILALAYLFNFINQKKPWF